MNKEIVILGDIEIGKWKCQYAKYPINMNNIDIDKIKTSNKVLFGKKVFKIFYCLERYGTNKVFIYNASKNERVFKNFG